MDYVVIVTFATVLLETAKTLADHGAYRSECVSLANRATDLVERAVAMTNAPKAPVSWTIWLNSFGDQKIMAIRIVRDFANLSLKESKELVERAPCALWTTSDESLAVKMYNELSALCGLEVELRKVEFPY